MEIKLQRAHQRRRHLKIHAFLLIISKRLNSKRKRRIVKRVRELSRKVLQQLNHPQQQKKRQLQPHPQQPQKPLKSPLS